MCNYTNRHQWTVTTDNDLYEKFRKFADKTRVPATRLLDESIEDLLVKYGEIAKEDKKNP